MNYVSQSQKWAESVVVTKGIASDANNELILKSSISGTSIHIAVGIARDNSETLNRFPFAITVRFYSQ